MEEPPRRFLCAETDTLYRLVRTPAGDVAHVFTTLHFVQFHVARYARLSASLADEYDELQRTHSTFLLIDMLFRCIAAHSEFPETDPIVSLQPLRLVQRKHAYVTPMVHKLLCTIRPRITTYHWDDCKSFMKQLFRQLFHCTLIWNRDRHQGLLPHEPFRIMPDADVWTRHLALLCRLQNRAAASLYGQYYAARHPLAAARCGDGDHPAPATDEPDGAVRGRSMHTPTDSGVCIERPRS